MTGAERNLMSTCIKDIKNKCSHGLDYLNRLIPTAQFYTLKLLVGKENLMMQDIAKIYYLYHSGFAVKIKDNLLI